MTTLLRENQNRIDRVIDRVGYCAIDLEKAALDPEIDTATREQLLELARSLDAIGIQVASVLYSVGVARSPHPDHGTTSI